jgi:hypothetical protein
MRKTWYLVGVALSALTAYVSGGNALLPMAAYAKTAAEPKVVNVVAKEYQFDLPDTLPAGPTFFHLTNEGTQIHHMTLVKLEQGKTLADFTALPPGPIPSWAVFVGGPNAPMPNGGQAEAVVDLSPGNYVVICLVPGPDGKPHMMNGMVKALTVTPTSEARKMPAGDMTLTLTNYKFSFSKPLTTGKHVIRVVNKGTQPHEAVMFRLEAGKTGDDVFKWVGGGMQGPPPAAPVGGISPEAPGKKGMLLVNLIPGNYALLCFVPDAKDGKPHAMHGMIYDFKVM